MIFDSKINGQIKLKKNWRGQYSIWVGSFEQSGPNYVEKIWREALEKVTFVPKSILILGLGGGTVVPLLIQKWPKAAITGVEIDPVMITLAKKYFGLDKMKIRIIQSDARKFHSKQKFDLILIDAYVGNKKLKYKISKELLTPRGTIISNLLQGLKTKMVYRPSAKVVSASSGAFGNT